MASVEVKTKVAISVSCRNLPSMDVASPSDPFALLSEWDGKQFVNTKKRTEWQLDKASPTFVTPLIVEYYFERSQSFRIDIYDVDEALNPEDLSKQDFIGYAEFTLAKVMSSSGARLTLPVLKKDGKPWPNCSITLRGDELQGSNQTATVQFKAKDLHKVSYFSKPTPRLEVGKQRSDGSFLLVHATDAVAKTTDPSYPAFTFPIGHVTDGNVDAIVFVRLVHYETESEARLLGEAMITTRDLLQLSADATAVQRYQAKFGRSQALAGALADGAKAQSAREAGYGARPTPTKVIGSGSFKELHATLRKQGKQGAESEAKDRGTLICTKFEVDMAPTFLDYVTGGLDMRLMVAIDFTASNGSPQDSSSLHYVPPHSPAHLNQYEQAISSIGSIVCDYTSRPHFPAYGFGASVKLKGQSQAQTSHCFPLTLDPAQPNVSGVSSLLQMYRQALKQLSLSGPTNFCELVQTAQTFTTDAYRPDYQHYTVLLILTDGLITDMQQTTDAIVAASQSPLSIIIVGIGNADFSNMEQLDGDEIRLTNSKGVKASSDIVQFVAMNKLQGLVRSSVAEATLEEVPRQVTTFMHMHNIDPLPPRNEERKSSGAAAAGPPGGAPYSPSSSAAAAAGGAPPGYNFGAAPSVPVRPAAGSRA